MDNYIINKGQKIYCIKSTPCGTLKQGETYYAGSRIFNQGYGPEITVEYKAYSNQQRIPDNTWNKITVSTRHVVDVAQIRNIKIESILQSE